MDWNAFRQQAHTAIDDICDYYLSLEKHQVLSKVEPGYLQKLLPREAPVESESFDQVRKDVFKFIMPGITHWQHPSFFAYYPSNSSPAGILAELYSNMFNCIGFNWACSPAYTELETIVLDWLCKALKLSPDFLSSGKGCGVIQGSASEALLTCLLGARKYQLQKGHSIDKLVFYCSDQTHTSGQKASNIALTKLRVIETNTKGQMTATALEEAILQDIDAGLVPCFCVGTFGTTTSGAIDDLDGLGVICEKYDIWYHIDAAYAGSFLVLDSFECPTDKADSFNMNTHKFLLTNFDCSPLFLKDRSKVVDALSISAPYYRNKQSESGLVTDFRDLQIPLGRRFRSLKLWFVMRLYGITKIQAHVQTHLDFAKYIEAKVIEEPKLELAVARNFALVTFKHVEGKTKELYNLIIKENVYLTMSHFNGEDIIRFVPGTLQTKKLHVEAFWEIVKRSINTV